MGSSATARPCIHHRKGIQPAVPIRFGSYNTFNMFLNHDEDQKNREDRVWDVIESMSCDIISLQEICRGRVRENELVERARSLGMTCYYEQPWWSEDDADAGKIALGESAHGLDLVMMWKPDKIRPVPRTLRSYDQGDFWHGLLKIEFVVPGDDGKEYVVGHADYHANPFANFGAGEREAQRVVSAFTRADTKRILDVGSEAPMRSPWLCAADWNGISADRVQDSAGKWVYYDDDPYAGERIPNPDGDGFSIAGKSWYGDLVYQASWENDDTSDTPRRWWANRQPGEILHAGGLRDAAPALHSKLPNGLAWHTTAGYWPGGDPFGERRIDAVRVTKEVVPALLGYEVIDSDLARSASDHLAIVVTYNPADIDYSQLYG
jgi:hypothetical protein